MKNYILAHDLGTTGNKATLYDREGRLVGSAFYAYRTDYARTGWAEQNPQDWWAAVCGSTHQLLAEARVRGDEVACISFSGQMQGAVALDKNALPLRSAIIWADQRSTEQTTQLAERLGEAEIYRITGHRLSATYSLSKFMWIRDHQPEIYKATYKFSHAKDAMVARLTGQFLTEPSDASGMNLYDIHKGVWSDRMIAAGELEAEKLPQIRPSTSIVGEVLPRVAEEVGVPAGTPVVIGGGDGACASVGAGSIKEDVVYGYVGSSAWLATASKSPLKGDDQKLVTFGHVIDGLYIPLGAMQAAGTSYQWGREQLGQIEKQAATSLGISPYDLMNASAETSPPGANGLLFLPHLLGERAPHWNPNARAAFIGLTVRHTHADLLRAIMEGVALHLRVILKALDQQGAKIEAVRVIGGGTRGRLWTQIMADIFGVPLHRLAVLEEATSMGAAVIGGVGIGLYPDFSLAEHINQIAETIYPNPNHRAAYAALLEAFEASYTALEPIFEKLARLPSATGG